MIKLDPGVDIRESSSVSKYKSVIRSLVAAEVENIKKIMNLQVYF